ncbi:MAG: FAD:protein FMN transferase [Akkermansiaceae bacterium]
MKRRRCLSILAGATAASMSGCVRGRESVVTKWGGVLFNAEVDLAIHDLPEKEATTLISRCVAEMQRLEQIFSLYVPDSVLCALNREGQVANPPAEFVSLVSDALEVAAKSGGAFDPTVQPYWVWLRESVEAGEVIDDAQRVRQLARVDYRKVHCAQEKVRYVDAGMAMTLNGIAQGWITDRVCELLREAGAKHCLVNLGEFHALGAQPSGKDWRVAIRGAEKAEVRLRGDALAVSCGAGLYFGTGEGNNHLINPRTGGCSEDRRIVAVTAADASTADALSTACAVLGDGEARDLVKKWEGARVRILRPGAGS